mgnify:CR=1 FL=1
MRTWPAAILDFAFERYFEDAGLFGTIEDGVARAEALKAIGREGDVLIVSVDGGCPGVANVKDGVIGATSQQYPLLMASLGIEAIANWAADGSKPENTPGKDFFDTGVALVTDKAVDGVESIDVATGMDRCWG